MWLNMHVSKHGMLFSNEPTLHKGEIATFFSAPKILFKTTQLS